MTSRIIKIKYNYLINDRIADNMMIVLTMKIAASKVLTY